jgi:hypothetical protein
MMGTAIPAFKEARREAARANITAKHKCNNNWKSTKNTGFGLKSSSGF